MKFLGCGILAAFLLCGPTDAQTLKPMTGGTFDGVPIERAIGTMNALGEWEISKEIEATIVTVSGVFKKGCEGRNDDPDNCTQSRFYVSIEDSRTSPNNSFAEYFLFRGPNGTAWRLPPNEKFKKIAADSFSIRLCGYQSPPSNSSFDVFGEYILQIHAPAKREPGLKFLVSLSALKNGQFGPGGCPWDAFVTPPPPTAIQIPSAHRKNR